MASLKERVEGNVTVWLLGTLLAGFLAGFAAYGTIEKIAGLEPTPKLRIEQLEASITSLKDEKEDLAKQLRECQVKPAIGDCPNVPDTTELVGLRRDLATCNTSLADVRRRYTVPQTSQWRHLLMVGSSGDQVAARLNEIGPAPKNVAVTYDSLANAFHIWYSGGGSGMRYEYGFASPDELVGTQPTRNYFVNDGVIIPAGIGRAGSLAVPLYFRVNQ